MWKEAPGGASIAAVASRVSGGGQPERHNQEAVRAFEERRKLCESLAKAVHDEPSTRN